MASKKDHIDSIFGEDQVLSQEVMQKYLNGDLSPQQMHEVEKMMVDDDFYDDVMEGMDLMKDSKLASSHISEINQSIPEIIGDKEGRRVFLPLLGGIAASLALIIGVVYLFNSGDQVEATNQEQALSAPVKETEKKEELLEKSKNEIIKQDGTDLKSKPKLENKKLSQELDDRELTEEPLNLEFRSADGTTTNSYGNGFEDRMDVVEETEVEEDELEIINEYEQTYYSDKGDISGDVSPSETELDLDNNLTNGFVNKDFKSNDDVILIEDAMDDSETIGSQMLAMNDPATQLVSRSGSVTAIESNERKQSKNRKEKVYKPTYREGSFQAKTTNKKEHNNKSKETDKTPGRSSIDLGADADMKFSSGQYAKAASLYELTLQQKPTDVHSLYMSGVAYLKINKTKKAAEKLVEVTSDKKIGDNALWYLAIAYANQGNNSKAKETLQKLIDKKSSAHLENAKAALKKL